MKKVITLAELIISIALLGVIVLGVTAFDVGSRYFLQSSDRKTQVLNEMTYILEHIGKNVSLATGDVNNPGVDVVDARTVRIREDVLWVEYRVQGNSNNLEFCPDFNINTSSCNTNYETLTFRLRRNVGEPNNDFYFSQDPNQILPLSIYNLRIRYDPSANRDATTNPEAVMTIIEGSNQVPVAFNSFSHSTN